MQINKKKQGFTLIELLVVIAIIAVLAIVVVLTINPVELLRRSRDSNRISDLSMIQTAISLYLADVSSTSMGTAATCYLQYAGASAPATVYEFPNAVTNENGALTGYTVTATTTCAQWFTSQTATTIASSSRAVNSTSGWIPINLSLISSGAPIREWPADPAYSAGATGSGNANAGHFYSYIPGSTNNSYKVAAKMESSLYSYGGTSDEESTDGGSDPAIYEQGSNLAL